MNHFGLEFEPANAGFIMHRFSGQDEPVLYFNPETGQWFLADEAAHEHLLFSIPGNERTFYLWLRNKMGEAQAKPPQRMVCEIAPESIAALREVIARAIVPCAACGKPICICGRCGCDDKANG